jgi:hypothetical protein
LGSKIFLLVFLLPTSAFACPPGESYSKGVLVTVDRNQNTTVINKFGNRLNRIPVLQAENVNLQRSGKYNLCLREVDDVFVITSAVLSSGF